MLEKHTNNRGRSVVRGWIKNLLLSTLETCTSNHPNCDKLVRPAVRELEEKLRKMTEQLSAHCVAIRDHYAAVIRLREECQKIRILIGRLVGKDY